MAFLKPQNPMTKGSDYFYPLTTADQVIMDGGYRLNDIVGKVKKSTITLYANGWSAEAPYCYSIGVDGLSDKVNMKMLPQYPDDFEGKQAMKAETAKISFASRNDNILTFECWEEVPTIDIPVDIEIDITYPSKGAEVELNYSVVGGTSEPEEPIQNMIWVNTDVEITDHIISKNEPSNPVENMVWISAGDNSNVAFHTMKINDINVNEVYPLCAKQYVSGAWVDVTAKSYQGGVWVSWITYLYNSGDQCTTITGGWERKAYGGTAGSVTLNPDNITIVSSDSSVCAGAKDFDINRISSYKTMKCIVSFTQSSTDGICRFGVSSTYSLGSSGIDSKWITQQSVQTGTQDAEMSLDISTVASGYPMLLAFHGTAVFKKVWFE